MKKLLIILAVTLLPAMALGASLVWTTDGTEDGCRVYMDGEQVAEVTTKTWTIPQDTMDDGLRHEFTVTAFNIRGESDESNVAVLPKKPMAPTTISLTE
jgi:uncharacterized protein YxeA